MQQQTSLPVMVILPPHGACAASICPLWPLPSLPQAEHSFPVATYSSTILRGLPASRLSPLSSILHARLTLIFLQTKGGQVTLLLKLL